MPKRRTRKPRVPPPALRVTDHALVRWFERVCGIDVEEVRRQVASPEVEAAYRALGRPSTDPENLDMTRA